jgi:ABC-type glycerol-3-phosphate transport system substrate-binding protein
MTSRTLSRPQFTAAALALGIALTLSACGGSATPLAAPAASSHADKTHVRQDGDA